MLPSAFEPSGPVDYRFALINCPHNGVVTAVGILGVPPPLACDMKASQYAQLWVPAGGRRWHQGETHAGTCSATICLVTSMDNFIFSFLFKSLLFRIFL